MGTTQIPPFTIPPPDQFDVPTYSIHVRLFGEQDAKLLLQLTRDDAIQKFVPWAKRVHDFDSALEMIHGFESAWQRGIMARYAIEKSGVFVGYCGLWSDVVPGYYEFGFAIAPSFRGQGIGTRTIERLIGIVHDTMHAHGVVAYVHDTNEASKAVITKLGLHPTDELDNGDRRYELHF